MNTFPASFFDGRSIRAHDVLVGRTADGGWTLTGEGIALSFAAAEVRVSDRLGTTPRILHLPDRARAETLAHEAISAALGEDATGAGGLPRSSLAALVHWLESRTRVAVAATVLVALAIGAMARWGVPAAAAGVATAVPPEVEAKAGRAALEQVGHFFAESHLTYTDQRRVRLLLDQLVEANGLPSTQLEFRRAGDMPNAFALPGWIVVMTDDLVTLAENDDQLGAVLAHELAHLEARHGLQSLLRESFALLVVAGVLGDLSTLTSFAAGLPLAILQNGYSREFEREADARALEFMDRAGIEREHLARILELLEESAGGEGGLSYLSTHPPTPERLQAIRGE